MKSNNTQAIPRQAKQPVWRLVLIWLSVCAVIAGWLTWKLADQVHPWEHVLHIPNGITDDPKSGSAIGAEPDFLSISPDDTTVAIGRANGDAEVWNLNSLKRVSTLDLPEPASAIDPEWPHKTSPRHLQHTENGHLFLLAPESGLYEFNDVGQQRHSYEPGNSWARALAISPEGNKIAYSTPSPHIFNWPEGGDQAIPNFDHTNGGRQGFDWMPDNKRFLFNDHLSVSLINTEDLSLQYRHYGLNEKLPPKRASNDDHRGWSGFHLDSRLVMNGSRFVTVYQSDSFWDVDNPEHQKLRFYDTETGVTLAEHILPKNPRSLRVTDDGLVVVLMVGDFHNFIHLFDAESMEKIGALDFKLINKFPPRIEVSPDHQHLLVESNRSWLVDLTDVAAPVKLKEYPSNTLLGRFTSESKTLVTMQMNLDVDVWKKRRDLSPLGAMVHWEYWGIQAVGIVCMFGIFIQVGRSTQRLRGEALPLLLWGAVLLLALGIGQQLAGLFLDPILTRVWGTDYGVSVGKTVWKSLGILLWFRVLIGLVRLETAWRKVALVLTMIGGILMIAITGWLGWLLSQIPGDLIQAEINKLVLTNGWRPKFSSMTSLIWSGVSANGVAAIWWILFRAPTRRIFVASVKTNPLAPSDDSR